MAKHDKGVQAIRPSRALNLSGVEVGKYAARILVGYLAGQEAGDLWCPGTQPRQPRRKRGADAWQGGYLAARRDRN